MAVCWIDIWTFEVKESPFNVQQIFYFQHDFLEKFSCTTKGPNNFGYSLFIVYKVLYKDICNVPLQSLLSCVLCIKFDYGCEFAQHSLTLTHWNINCVGDFTKWQ